MTISQQRLMLADAGLRLVEPTKALSVQVGLVQPGRLPVAGVETARKVFDNTRPSNQLMTRWASSEGKPI